jgi:hypothetical protein
VGSINNPYDASYKIMYNVQNEKKCRKNDRLSTSIKKFVENLVCDIRKRSRASSFVVHGDSFLLGSRLLWECVISRKKSRKNGL